MKSLAILALFVSLAAPLMADDAVTAPTPNAKDLKALNTAIDNQKIAKAQSSAPVVNISGYADTSYTKAMSGSSGLAGQTVTKSGSLTTEKVSLSVTTADKNNGWFAGAQVDVIHCSSK